MNKKLRYLILFILVCLPICNPVSIRYNYSGIEPWHFQSWLYEGVVVFVLFTFFAMLPYWCLVGHLFARWVGSSWKSFFLGNIPIIFNAAGEIIYYVILRKEPWDMPWLAYLIGSHLDKNFIVKLGLTSDLLAILIAAFTFFCLFIAGYGIRKHKLTDPLPAREE